MGIGMELTKIYREYYPSKSSGGFTSYGYEQINRYHSDLVSKYLRNGIYSDMIKKGEISKYKVNDIIKSAKLSNKPKGKGLGILASEKSNNIISKYYGDSGEYGMLLYLIIK